MSYQIKLLGCFLNRRNKPAVKRLAQLLINRVAVVGAEHRKGLPHSAVYLTSPPVGNIVKGKRTCVIDGEAPFECNGAVISRFATSHDCEGSSGYTFLMPDGKKISVCTDLGVVTEDVRKAISGSDAVLIESNHDVDMLNKGPYPPELKMRIMSEKGHISNNACSAELVRLLNSGTKRFILGHLSQKNNTPLLALSSAEAALADKGAKNGRDYLLSVAAPSENRVTVI